MDDLREDAVATIGVLLVVVPIALILMVGVFMVWVVTWLIHWSLGLCATLILIGLILLLITDVTA